jgi:cation transport regulator ChaC
MLYFAYGSNMDEETLADKGVEFKTLGRGKVPDVRLVFHVPDKNGTGKADLQDQKGSATEGVVYDIPEAGMALLESLEAGHGYYRRQALMVQTSKGELECLVYRATKFRAGLKPSPGYLQTIIRGAEAHLLSPEYISFLKSHDTAEESA